MPKGLVETEPVNKEIFMQVLARKNSSIRQLDEAIEVECSDKTMRRSLNKGKMRKQYIEQIARYLDVDPRLLTGELVKNASRTTDPLLKKIYMRPLNHIEEYPYFRAEREKISLETVDETVERILSIVGISPSQFTEKGSEDQYEFERDLFSAILPVIYKHFSGDGYGDPEMTESQRIIVNLEEQHTSALEQNYANNILRKRLLEKVPEGFTKKQIEKMSTEELINLDFSLQAKNHSIGKFLSNMKKETCKMKQNEIKEFIERMAEFGDIWTEDQVSDVYGDVSLKEAISSRMERIGMIADIITNVLNDKEK